MDKIYPYLELQAVMYYQPAGKPKSRCLLTLHREMIETVVIFDEVGDSIIDVVENLANQVLKDYRLRFEYVTWVAHLRGENEFFRLRFSWDGEALYDMKWEPAERYQIEAALDHLVGSFRTRLELKSI